MIRGVRGATTVKQNDEKEIIEATEALLRKMIEENKIEADMVASVFISVTDDITAVFPAKAMRLIKGWKYVPVMCMQEIPVTSSLKRCIRVMMHVNTTIPQQDICHIYLEEAIKLRPDLNSVNQS
ncbi:chorismate mutase [Bacillus sp. S/N-304-OC-R1]|uniref:chorismate mutase n=1 Tax=Bacillus sp. S/N-304-OC-R1 TaxID=2758034 RepID=UPI001C8D77C2|nr:chorismate mutase [Bacillus sp. S/N-304-OC-R1]MBY0122592.1 chorismate mutase [Bacillus sp. S/N-304-OC-R1]